MEGRGSLDFENFLQPMITELLKQSIGVVSEKPKISEVSSGQPRIERNDRTGMGLSGFGDRFKLSVPYAGMLLTWDVVFNCSSPDSPPDFDLNDDAFTNYITVDCLEQTMPSLMHWSPDDRHAFKNVVAELLQLFKKYQIDQLKGSQAQLPISDYEEVIESGLVTSDNFEVFVNTSGVISFLFSLNLDMSDYEVQDIDREYAIHVSTYYRGPNGNSMSKPIIRMTSALLDVMNTRQFNQKHETTCSESSSLVDFLRRLSYKAEKSILQHKVKPLTKRKRFVLEILNFLGASVIEFDALEFNHVSFLLDLDGFSCILGVSLSNSFPNTRPIYTLQSVYNTDTKNCLDRIPFHASWEYSTMITKALDYVESQMRDMKNELVSI